MKRYVLQDIGPDVQEVVDKVQALVEQGGDDATLLTPADKEKLDKISGIRYDSTAYWEEHALFIPDAGEIIIYYDYKTIVEDEVTKYIPGIKIGSGNAYLSDLAFLGQDQEISLAEHINNHFVHTTAEEKARWDNKINISDHEGVVDETLIFDRN